VPNNRNAQYTEHFPLKIMMKEQILKVKCSFCGKEIECPKDMIDTEKHSCFECFEKLKDSWSDIEKGKIHIDMPSEKLNQVLPEVLTDSMVEKIFPKVWSDKKQELKQLSKKELAREMFGAGAYIAIDNMIKMHKSEQEKKNNDTKK